MSHHKQRILIAGGSHAEIPLIKAAQALGFYVISSGNRPDGLGHQFADEMQLADYSDMEAMLALAKKHRIDAICAGCNDFSALSAAHVAERLNLPGHDSLKTAEIIHHKDAYRKYASGIGIPGPKAAGFSCLKDAVSAVQEFKLPVLVKPVDLTGGKGISKVVHLLGALEALENAFAISKIKRVVIEEFIEGSRHGFSAILRSGKIVFSFSDDEHYHLSPYLVSGASSPTSCSSASIQKIIEYSERIASDLSLVDGIFHVQFIEREPDDPIIIEICRRPPGDLYVELVRHATGAPYSEWIIRAAAGLDISCVQDFPVNGNVTRHCLMAEQNGVFAGFDFDECIRNSIIDSVVWAMVGDIVNDAHNQKLGVIFLKNSCEFNKVSDKERPDLQKLLRAMIL